MELYLILEFIETALFDIQHVDFELHFSRL